MSNPYLVNLLCMVVMSLGFVAAAVGDEPAQLDKLVSQLGDEDYQIRQQAMMSLTQDDELDLTELSAKLNNEMALEQQHRLVGVIRHHLIRKMIEDADLDDERASIGIGLLGLVAEQTPDGDRPAIVVTTTYPGFPGYSHLERDDLIYSINKKRIPAGLDRTGIQQFCMELIQSTGVGQSIELGIQRDGQAIDVSFELTPYTALATFYLTRGSTRLLPTLKEEYEQMISQQLLELIPKMNEMQPELLQFDDGESNGDNEQSPDSLVD